MFDELFDVFKEHEVRRIGLRQPLSIVCPASQMGQALLFLAPAAGVKVMPNISSMICGIFL